MIDKIFSIDYSENYFQNNCYEDDDEDHIESESDRVIHEFMIEYGRQRFAQLGLTPPDKRHNQFNIYD